MHNYFTMPPHYNVRPQRLNLELSIFYIEVDHTSDMKIISKMSVYTVITKLSTKALFTCLYNL